MQIDWDPKKEASNIAMHGVSFEEAATVFGDALSDTFDDPDHSFDEHRFVIIGVAETGRMLMVAHSDDGENIRIISAREPTSGERRSYERN